MPITPDDLKSSLETVHKAASQAAGQDRSIKASAEERLLVVDARLKELKPTTLTKLDDADEYLDLMHERGRLSVVLAHR